MKYVNYRNCNVRSEVEYSTPFVSPVHRNEPILRQNHEYSHIETLPLAATLQQRPDLLQMNKVNASLVAWLLSLLKRLLQAESTVAVQSVLNFDEQITGREIASSLSI